MTLRLVSKNETNKLTRSVWAWLDTFALCVRERDFSGGRALFAPDAHGFGTVVRVSGRRSVLERGQWGRVWPRTAGFRFERAGGRLELAEDGLMAVAMVTWKACNQPEPQRLVFDRRGRATILLRRTGLDSPWIARHSHFSFDPPARPAGKKSERASA